MNRQIKILFLLSLSVIIFTIFFIIRKNNFNTETITIILPDNREIIAEIADNDEERQIGLMFREKLDENTGMFFIFEEEKELSFWMKNTLIPLDIIFIDENLKILNIEKAEPCKADPCPTYLSKFPAQYVLEINQSLDKKYENNKIKVKR